MATSNVTTPLLGNQPGDVDLEPGRDQPEQGRCFQLFKSLLLGIKIEINLTGLFVALIYGFCVAIEFLVYFLGALGEAFLDFLRGLFLLDLPETPNDSSHIVALLLRWLCVLVVVGLFWLFLRGPRF